MNLAAADPSGEIADGARVLARDDGAYPQSLKCLSDPPDQLYVLGNIPKKSMIAIVGTRNADAPARRFTARLAQEIVGQGFGIISGGALGIDTAAHQGALEVDGTTVAVIGSGFDYLYPEANRALFAQMMDKGALVTEFAPQQPPTKWTFPRRNRLVAAMADAVVVVQAGQRSGALITSRLARSLNRPVGAVPGSPSDPRNRGSNGLLRDGARMVETVSDVLALVEKTSVNQQLDLPTARVQGMNAAGSARATLSPVELKIVDLLGTRPLHIDEISAETGLNPGETSAALMALEIAGLVEDQGGKTYVRVG